MFRYDVSKSEAATAAVEAISARLWSPSEQESGCQLDTGIRKPSLQLVSMKESFDLELLSRFYNELMIPNFPLEDERDDLDDWVYCLDPAHHLTSNQIEQQPHPTMDVIMLLIREEMACGVDENISSTRTTIAAGVAFEYYKQAQCGLLSYMVVSDDFRRLGIMRSLHPVACHAMQVLHQECFSATVAETNNRTKFSPTIKAILAETNTPEAGDVPPSVIRKRHEILYQLGYRHLKFPYVQPALSEDMENFEEIILLIHSPGDMSHTSIETKILRDYVVDFFQSVTGYDSDSYKKDWYYQLVEWFWKENPSTDIARDLPWEDITQNMKECMAISASNTLSANQSTKLFDVDAKTDSNHNFIEENTNHSFGSKPDPSIERQKDHVIVVGAGIAGLVSTVTLAEKYLEKQQTRQNSLDKNDQSQHGDSLTITLIEAQAFVGGRIRTVVTKEAETLENINEHKESHSFVFSNDRLSHSQKVDRFSPWPVAIGAEFVHGVDSMANQLIEDHEEWLVHETFDLCELPEQYPSRNSFVQRRSSLSLSLEQRKNPHVHMFIDGKCYPMQHHQVDHESEGISSKTEKDRVEQLITRANHIWHNLQSISEEVEIRNDEKNWVNYRRDMSLDEFIDDQLSNEGGSLNSAEVEKVKQILESLFSNTAGSSNKFLGVHEASREEWNWEYTESNFRLEKCFNEFVKFYLDRISQINEQEASINSGLKINIEIECPVLEIGSTSNKKRNDYDEKSNPPVRVLTATGRTFLCDKCIVTVPLGVLKSKKLTFSDAYKIPRKMQEAIDTINMFSGMKAHMLLKVGIDIQLISKRMKNTELIFCPGEIFSQIWIRRNEESVFLTGFCVANCRDQLIQMVMNSGKMENESKSKIAKASMLSQVQRVFESSDDGENIFIESSSPTCSTFALHDWSDDEFTLGIYSSPSVGAGWGGKVHNGSIGGDAKPLTHRDYLATPINNEIWIAGEHANRTTCATVQSAMESGARAANEMYKVLRSG